VHLCSVCERHCNILVRAQQVAKVPLADHHDMVKAAPSYRVSESLRMSVLRWRSRCNRPIPDAHRTKPPDQDVAMCPIAKTFRGVCSQAYGFVT
jgi:hypothetical protein